VHVEVHSDTRKAIVKLGSGLDLTVQDDDPVVKVDVAGQATLQIGKDGSIKIESQTAISIKGGSDVKIEASGQLTLKGATVNIN
jgi:hypothetical protein